jgi:glutamyl-tRNA(Gln) amidotransferase subunit E
MSDFLFKPFNEMTDADYEAVGFKSGLEIHQQLLTEKKLFCRCPAAKYSEHYDAEILRHMRPTLSELGEYDGTALMEFKTKKDIIYRIHRETVCTYEMDDTPPFLINEDALNIGLEIGLLYGSKLVDEIHIARKQYLDGSIPTGFQRTSIIALDGKLPYKDRQIEIIQLSIEEDSCREVSDFGHQRVYLTDRLGMPLIETVTGPDMRTPKEAADVAQILRKLVRCTGKVRTGIGAARQDVNVSVTGGTRVEIKGVPKIADIPLLTYNEAMRQWNLLRLRDELHRRGIYSDTFEAKYIDITKLIKKTHYHPIKEAVALGYVVKCVLLKGFKELLNWKTQTDTYFSREIADRLRVIACLTTIPNIVHSDSRGETVSSSDWMKIKKTMSASDDDTLVITWGTIQDAETAAKEIIIRAKEAAAGVPSETRQALSDGTNGFERILPGPDRMYPDTDLPPKRITAERIQQLKSTLAEPYWERETWYRSLGVPEDIIPELSISKYSDLFKDAVRKGISPVTASVAIIQYPKRLKKMKYDISRLNTDIFNSIFNALCEKKILREAIFPMLEIYLETGELLLLSPACPTCLNEEIDKCSVKINELKMYHRKNRKLLLMALVMNSLKGRVEGSKAASLIGLRS